ncbi:amidohydrolase family protein [Gandjariella thermophila]|uniref:Putative amidohydrolase (Aminocarboxymuconate-semialdehyde decarboxylase) n=1 Tax=Gandjariella thermophila TaxID=1931992 RepID=A0A4D4JI00_9PSEU|nr:amidohydrolase family protein [Gandjariella thermophila]GDY33507.1 putative amidohydrolase (aminocarboxymuconate-semialdehyde decarboxylase) [Gandjariella thermophila]
MRIDTHAHVYPRDYLDLLADYGVDTRVHRDLGADDTAEDLHARFALMDRAGVDVHVVSVAPMTGLFADAVPAVTTSRMINDRYRKLVEQYPDRLRAFAAVPLPHVDAAVAELDRVLADPGVLGVTVTTTVAGRPLTDPAFEPFWAELDRRATVLYVHPAGADAHSTQIADAHLTWMVGAPVEDMVAAAQLITAGFPSRYPNVRILNSHLGGAVPMMLRRWDNQARFEAPDAPLPPSTAARLMWYDTVTHGSTAALRAAVDELGADRLVLGSDFPYQSGERYVDAVRYVARSGLDPAAAHDVLDVNAAQLLGLTGR